MEDHKRTPVGRFVHNTWTNLNIRCANGKHRNMQTPNKCATYADVFIVFSRAQFKSWCWEHEKEIVTLSRPSLDRIDKNKGYSLDNVQIIELADNISKDKVKFDGLGSVCSRCSKYTLKDDLVKTSRNRHGISNVCKRCECLRGRVPAHLRRIAPRSNLKYAA